MEKRKCMIFCTADCIHNNGRGCYNLCEHPKHENMITVSDRVYINTCSFKESRDRGQK